MDAHENAAEDVEELLFLYEKTGAVSLAPFKSLWRSRTFSFIHEGCTKRSRGQEFLQVLYSTCLARLQPEASIVALAGAIYCLYCLFQTQIGTPKILVYLSLEDTHALVAAVAQLRAHCVTEAVAVVHRMMREHCFVYGAVSTSATRHRADLAARALEAQRRNKMMRQALLESAPAELLWTLQEDDSLEKFEAWAQHFMENPAARAPVADILKELEATGPAVKKLSRDSSKNGDKQKNTGRAVPGVAPSGRSSPASAATPAAPAGAMEDSGNEDDEGLEKEELDEWDNFFENELETADAEELETADAEEGSSQ